MKQERHSQDKRAAARKGEKKEMEKKTVKGHARKKSK